MWVGAFRILEGPKRLGLAGVVGGRQFKRRLFHGCAWWGTVVAQKGVSAWSKPRCDAYNEMNCRDQSPFLVPMNRKDQAIYLPSHPHPSGKRAADGTRCQTVPYMAGVYE